VPRAAVSVEAAMRVPSRGRHAECAKARRGLFEPVDPTVRAARIAGRPAPSKRYGSANAPLTPRKHASPSRRPLPPDLGIFGAGQVSPATIGNLDEHDRQSLHVTSRILTPSSRALVRHPPCPLSQAASTFRRCAPSADTRRITTTHPSSKEYPCPTEPSPARAPHPTRSNC
jgi:hypothetical protein